MVVVNTVRATDPWRVGADDHRWEPSSSEISGAEEAVYLRDDELPIGILWFLVFRRVEG